MVDEYEDEAQRYAICSSLWEKNREAVRGIETRSLPGEVRVITREDGGGVLRGYALVYNELSDDLGGFRERVLPGAADESAQTDDIRCLINHDPNLILGRTSAGTLRLFPDERGLVYEVDLPNISYAQDIRVSVERGDVTGCSFSFDVIQDNWIREDGVDIRELHRIRLYDVGPVTFPAYPQTTVVARSIMRAHGIDPDRLARALSRGTELADEDRAVIAQAIDALSQYLPAGEQVQPAEAQEQDQAVLEALRLRLELAERL